MDKYRSSDYLAKFTELCPTTNTFIDSYIPGSKRAISAIIGHNVIEVEDHHVHIPQNPGFDVIGAAVTLGNGNCFHSHAEIEIFLTFQGKYKIVSGEKRANGNYITLEKFDLIAVPADTFRCFEGVELSNYLFQVTNALPQYVLWRPDIIEESQGTGLVLLDDHKLIDTTRGYKIPAGAKEITPFSEEELSKVNILTVDELEKVTFHYKQANWLQFTPGLEICYVIGPKDASYDFHLKFSCEINGFIFKLNTPSIITLQNSQAAAIIMFKGSAWVTLQLKDDEHRILIEEGDTLYIPAGTNYSLESVPSTEARFYMFMNSNYPTISLASDIKNDNSSLENLM